MAMDLGMSLAPGIGGGIFPVLDANFQTGVYPTLTTTRATAGYAETNAGLLTLFGTGTPRITDKGLLVESARTNVVLWNRDLTNAAWTKTSITAALDQTGADGTATAATSLTATGANGTCLQAITLASSARFQSAYVKRITGSGTIQMTMDNGATWTTITVTSSYTQLSIPTQTLANPTVGFRIVTAGDAIAVDFVQNENGAFKTSPIATTTASATRNVDLVSIAGLSIAPPYTLYVDVSPVSPVPIAQPADYLSAGSLVNGAGIYTAAPWVRAASATVALPVFGGSTTILKAAGRFATNDVRGYAQGFGPPDAADTSAAIPTITQLDIGKVIFGGAVPCTYFRRVQIYNFGMTDAQLAALVA